jgi:hypothetical protein
MHAKTTPSGARICQVLLPLLVTATLIVLPWIAAAQGLTGALIGTVKDDQGGVLPGAHIHISSPALLGGLAELTTNEKGQLRFPALPPGAYVLDIALQGFAPVSRRGHRDRPRRHHREDGCPRIGRGCGIDCCRGTRPANRSSRPRIWDSVRPR